MCVRVSSASLYLSVTVCDSVRRSRCNVHVLRVLHRDRRIRYIAVIGASVSGRLPGETQTDGCAMARPSESLVEVFLNGDIHDYPHFARGGNDLVPPFAADSLCAASVNMVEMETWMTSHSGVVCCAPPPDPLSLGGCTAR